MQSERIVVLISPAEKRRLQQRARSNKQSLGAYVRAALAREASVGREGQLSKDQWEVLEQAAKRASQALQRGNRALEKAFGEIEKTRAHFGKAAALPADEGAGHSAARRRAAKEGT